MNRKFLKKFMSRAGWRISDAHLFMEHIADAASYEPNLPELTLLHLVRQALLSLRSDGGWQWETEGEDGAPIQIQSENAAREYSQTVSGFRWEKPWVELRYPVEWDWSNADATLQSPFKIPSEPTQDRLEWLIKTSRRQQELLIFEVLTHGAARRRAADGREFIIPNKHHSELLNEALQEIPAAQQEKWVEEYLDLLLKPFSVGFMDDFDDEKPDHMVRRLEQVPTVRFTCEDGTEGAVVVQVHPLLVDENERRAFYPVVVGISLWAPREMPQGAEKLLWRQAPQVGQWSSAERAANWLRVLAALDELEARWRGDDEDGEVSLPALPTPEVMSNPSRYLLEGPTRLDKRAATLVAYAHGLNLPRKWTAIRAWSLLEKAEIERLQREHGDAAFDAGEQGRGKSKKRRGALLQRRMRANGESVIELSEEAARVLAERESLRGFRRLVRDDDGVQREYLIKRVKTPMGHIEIRLSWYGAAWPLISDTLDYQQSRLSALDVGQSLQQPSLFEELEERRRAALNGQLRQMESIRDARIVMDLILRSFGRDGENPLHIPAWQLRALLECENNDDGFRRVEGCLRALQEVRFYVHAEANGPGAAAHSFGPFIGDVKYIGRGPGRHTDGDYYLQVSPGAIGCLQVFSSGQYQARGSERVLTYDWNATLPKETRLGGYTRSFLALAPYYDRAKGFTPTQSNLLRWIERELTLCKDAHRVAHQTRRAAETDPDADNPRLYNRDFCPILPPNRGFYGALGHFARNPENGRKLHGASTRSESLLGVMNQTLPPPRARAERRAIVTQALQDMKAVVEEALNGQVAAWQKVPDNKAGRWLTLAQAADLPERVLASEVAWFFFIAPDFRERLSQDLEKYHAARFADGKSPYPIRVTQDRDEARKGHLQAAGERFAADGDSEPVRARLRAHRAVKRLSQAKVGEIFGVSQKTIDNWEKGPLPGDAGRVRGKPIPHEVLPLLLRWLETGETPSAEELARRTTRRSGRRNATSD